MKTVAITEESSETTEQFIERLRTSSLDFIRYEIVMAEKSLSRMKAVQILATPILVVLIFLAFAGEMGPIREWTLPMLVGELTGIAPVLVLMGIAFTQMRETQSHLQRLTDRLEVESSQST